MRRRKRNEQDERRKRDKSFLREKAPVKFHGLQAFERQVSSKADKTFPRQKLVCSDIYFKTDKKLSEGISTLFLVHGRLIC